MSVPTIADIRNAIFSDASQHGLDPNRLLTQCRVESGFNINARSPVGALGLFQLMPATAKELNVDPLDWRANILGGVTLMAQLLKEFQGNYEYALAAYNWGSGNLTRLLGSKPTDWKKELPEETQNYLTSILS